MRNIFQRYVRSALTVLIILVFSVAVFAPQNLSALSSDAPCRTAEVVFVRGSGEKLNDKEFVEFRAKLDADLNRRVGSKPNYYELGTEFYGGNKYPAVSVSPWENKIDATLPWARSKDAEYSNSVKSGEGELRTYLAQRTSKCPNSRIVLAGYSQGAQVVGNVLFGLSQSIKSRVAFVALFGDPKLYLPEGAKVWEGCAGRNISPWRRGNPLCYVHSGISMAREPYVPSDMIGKVGSWCDKKDFVCTGSATNLLIGNTHSQYVDKGYIDQAAKEIAGKFVKSSIMPSSVDTTNKIGVTYAVSSKESSNEGAVWEKFYARIKTLILGKETENTNVSLAGAETDSPKVTILPALDEFYAKPGEEITFDVMMSHNEDSELFTRYEWDFNNDGIVDKTTQSFSTTHVYDQSYEGAASVRAYIATGESGTAQFTVHVGQTVLKDLLPGVVSGLRISQQQTGAIKTVILSWNASANTEAYSVYIDGEAAGYVDANTTSITLTDVPNDIEHIFGVSAGNSAASSTVATVVVPVLTTPPPVVPPVTPPAPTKPLSPACKALTNLKPYLHPTVYRLLWQTLRCDK